MFIIWRGWGWLVLPFFLLVWALADGPVASIYRSAAYGDAEAPLYNAEKAICWAIAFFVVALPLAALSFWRRHAERTRTPEEHAQEAQQRLIGMQKFEEVRLAGGDSPDPQLQAYLSGQAQLAPIFRPKSHFFFIPFWITPFLFVALGILLLVLNVPTAIAEAR